MIILGIDPGYAIIGFGIISYSNGKYVPLEYGAITTSADTEFLNRLEIIFTHLNTIIKKWKPDAMAIEKLYFNSNQTTAICVAEARGVTLLSAQLCKIPVYEYTPLQVKTAVTSYGRAEKKQVMEMTRKLLHLKEVPKPDDTADALAIAICHAQACGTLLRSKLFLKHSKEIEY